MQFRGQGPANKKTSTFEKKIWKAPKLEIGKMENQTTKFSFIPIDFILESLSTRERKEKLIQYNLDQSLIFQRYRFSGNFSKNSIADYELLIKEFLTTESLKALIIDGSPTYPVNLEIEQMNSTVISMEFFDKILDTGK